MPKCSFILPTLVNPKKYTLTSTAALVITMGLVHEVCKPDAECYRRPSMQEIMSLVSIETTA